MTYTVEPRYGGWVMFLWRKEEIVGVAWRKTRSAAVEVGETECGK